MDDGRMIQYNIIQNIVLNLSEIILFTVGKCDIPTAKFFFLGF